MNDSTSFAQAQMTLLEVDRLAACERVIERGIKTFVEVGDALLTIRDNRLYRASHGTFEAYCRERWGWKRAHAYRLIEASEVVGSLSPIGDIPTPATESQARELAPLRDTPSEMAEAWAEAVEESGGKPTASIVREVVERRQSTLSPEPATPMPEPDPWGDEELALRRRLDSGETVPVSYRHHQNLIDWAIEQGLFVRIDRQSEWGNPFKIGRDGDRDDVIRKYRDYFLPNTGLVDQVSGLRGKALGCWCAPEPCHGDVLAWEAERGL